MWVFSHPIHGETKKIEETRRTDEEWRLAKASKGTKSSASKSATGPTAALAPASTSTLDGWIPKKRKSEVGISVDAKGEDEVEDEGASRRLSLGGSIVCDEEDDLAMLIGNKRRREEEVREFAQQIGEEMAMEMDTGIRVNEDLRKALC